jgi:predicted Zn-dependent protease
LKVVDLNEATGLPATEGLKYLDEIPLTKQSAVLMEKAGELERAQKHMPQALERYNAALKLKPSPQQKLRLLMIVGDLQAAAGNSQAAVDAYKQIMADIPDYPNATLVYRRLADLSRKLGKTKDAEDFASKAQGGMKK